MLCWCLYLWSYGYFYVGKMYLFLFLLNIDFWRIRRWFNYFIYCHRFAVQFKSLWWVLVARERQKYTYLCLYEKPWVPIPVFLSIDAAIRNDQMHFSHVCHGHLRCQHKYLLWALDWAILDVSIFCYARSYMSISLLVVSSWYPENSFKKNEFNAWDWFEEDCWKDEWCIRCGAEGMICYT